MKARSPSEQASPMRFLLSLLKLISWTVVSLLALLLSLALHLNTAPTRETARKQLVDFANGEIAGQIEIGEIETLLPWKIVVRDARVYDPGGKLVLSAKRLEAVPNLGALFSGWIHFEHVDTQGVEVGLVENDAGLPTLADAFLPKNPKPDDGVPPPIGASIDKIVVRDAIIRGDVPMIDGLELRDVDMDLQMRVRDEFVLRFLKGSAELVAPYDFKAKIAPLSGAIHSESDKGIRFDASLVTHRLGYEERADVRFRLQNDEIDLLVHADPLHASLAAAVGVPGTELLRGKVEGYFHLQGTPEKLRFYTHPTTDGGAARVRGEITEAQVRIFADTDGPFSLPGVIADVTAVTLDARGEVRLIGEEDPRFHVEIEDGSFEEFTIPKVTAEGRLAIAEEKVHIEQAQALLGGGTVNLRGTAGFDGSLDLKAQGRVASLRQEPNVHRLAPGLSGSANLDAHIVSGPDGPVEIEMNARTNNVQYPGIATKSATVRGRVVLAPAGPQFDLDVHGEEVKAGGYAFGHVDADIQQNTPGQIAFDASAKTEDGRTLAAEGQANVSDPDGVEVMIDNARVQSGDDVWEGELQTLRIAKNGDVRVDKLRLGDEDSHLHVDGLISPEGHSDFTAELLNYSAEELGAVLGLKMDDVEGILNGRLSLTGKMADPTFTFEGSVTEGSVGQLSGVSINGSAKYQKGVMELDVEGDVKDHGALKVSGQILLEGPLSEPIDTLAGGIFDITFETKDFELSLLQRFLPEQHPVSGRLTASGKLSGPVVAPELEADFEVSELRYLDYAPIDLSGGVDYQQGYLISRVIMTDVHGPLLEAEGNLLFDVTYALSHPQEAMEAIATTPWRLSFRSEHRTFEKWPAWLSDHVPVSMHDVSMSLVAGFAGGTSSTNGYADVVLEWADEETSLFGCGAGGAAPHIEVRANLSEGRTKVDVRGFIAGESALRGAFSAETPLDDWLAGAPVNITEPAALVLKMPRMPIASIPELCLFAEGELEGKLELYGLFTTTPRGQLALKGKDVTFFNAAPGQLEVNVNVEPTEVTAKAQMVSEDGGRIDLDGYFPLEFENPFLPKLKPERSALNLDVRNASLAPLLAWVPQIESAGGHVDGVVQVRSREGKLDMSGELVLDDGFIKIGSLGQHLSRMNGRLILHSDWIELDQITGYDDGEVSLNGALYFDGWAPSRIRLNASTKRFPVRSEGLVLARATTEFGLEGQFGIEAAELNVVVKDANIALPEANDRQTQPLQEHPDIHVVGRHQMEVEELTEYPLRVSVDASKPFWVRRSDFVVQIAAEIEAIYKQEELYLSGYVDMRRGFFEVYGKRFELEWGTMNFDGTSSMDPGVNLKATHELSGGGTVSVVVSGTLLRPEIEFSSSESSNQGEIIALLLGGSRSNNQDTAGDQTQNFLLGIAAGMLTLTLRDEFGDYIPILSFDYDRGVGIRAGWDADWLIPKAFRSFVTGAYFEGYLKSADGTTGPSAATASDARSGGVGVKFMLELQHPDNFITQIMYMVPNNARLDFIWEP